MVKDAPRIALAIALLAASACAQVAGPPADRAQPRPAGPEAQDTRPLQPEAATGRRTHAASHAAHAMVAAANPLAVEAGLAMLARGGNAIDAAVAAQLVLNLVESQASGLGGGAYLLYYDAGENTLHAYDGRETAPADAGPDLFLDSSGRPLPFREALPGGRAVGVPGVARLLEQVHRAHGKLPWKDLFAPAITLAQDGYPLSERTHRLLARVPELAHDPQARALYFLPGGSPKPAGTRLRNPAFAATLRALAEAGADGFYRGAVAYDVVAAVRTHAANPGRMRAEDLREYRVRAVEPLCRPYRRYRVCGMPPSSSGGIAVLQILGILSHFDLASLRADSSAAAHLLAEAGRLAFADRNRYVADDRFVAVPVEGLLDSDYLAARAASIRTERSMGRAQAGHPPDTRAAFADSTGTEAAGTSHIAIVDAAGNAVSMTTSIESSFGARLMAGGFLLNNELTDFDFSPRDDGRLVANRVEPGKRPRSSMAPTIVFDEDGRVRVVIGSAGGSRIINYVAKALVAILDWNMDVQAALDAPNVGSRNGPTELERGSEAERLAPALAAMGHPIGIVDMTSGTHAIVRTSAGWSGGADPRREGAAKGY